MATKGTPRPPRSQRFQLNAAVHLFLIQNNRVLLLRRANTGYQDGNYSVVAGHLDGGEDIISATVREASEEIGIQIMPAALRVVGVMHRNAESAHDDERVDFFVATTEWTGQPANREPDKCDELRWATIDHLPVNTVPYVRRALENYRQGIWFDSFGWPDQRPLGDH